jgi:hypothetical protein
MQNLMQLARQYLPTGIKRMAGGYAWSYAFDVEEWRVARENLLKLLQNDQRKADEASIRSYISCCAESIGSVHPLPDLA